MRKALALQGVLGVALVAGGVGWLFGPAYALLVVGVAFLFGAWSSR